jgi:hypothetical protein
MLINPIEIREISISVDIGGFNTRYITPPKSIEIDEKYLKYRNAQKLAKDITITNNSRHFVVIDGSFIFGDFIEALMVEKNYQAKRIVISTLSMNQNNVDSLQNLLVGGYVQQLDLIVSDFFFSHERSMLVPYIYEKLDIDDKFQFAAAGTHCKICLIETECGRKIIIHGSANLRSSSNIEQFVIEDNEILFDFNMEIQDKILHKYKTIKKSIRASKLWETIK